MKIDRSRALDAALAVANQAGEVISRVYAAPFDVEYKDVDDPVTRADKEANALICAALARDFPGVPIVAEESDPSTYAGFAKSDVAWFVDPLDGTREFVAKNGEFAVMIGLAEAGRATVGVLVCPALGRTFVGAEGIGAFEIDARGTKKPIRVSSHATIRGARVVVSRSHPPSADAMKRMSDLGLVVMPCGSAGVKAAKVACGEADLYAQPGRAGKLWDACAPEAIVRAAGGEWRTAHGDGYDYASEALENDRGALAGNAEIVAAIVREMKW